MAQWQRIAIAPSQFHPPHIYLAREQQHYLSRVLRLKSGDRFIAMDGQGLWWLSRIEVATEENSPQGWMGVIEEEIPVRTELPVTVTLIAALPKGNGFDDVVRTSTELGVDCILPTLSDRTLLEPSPRKIERWRRIAREAAEQSERQVIPVVADPLPFASVLQSIRDLQRNQVPASSKIPGRGQRPLTPAMDTLFSHTSLTISKPSYICVARGDTPHLFDCLQQTSHPSITLAIGPEGGWTPEEIEKAIDAGFQPVSLGRRVLRAVTAPIAALSLVAAALERAK